MDFLLFIHLLALLFSFFVVGALLGALFINSKARENSLVQTKEILVQTKERLKVLMFGWEFPPFNSGGLGVACMGILRALSNKNVDVVFVMPKRLPHNIPYARVISAELQSYTVSVHSLNSPVTPYTTSESYAQFIDGTPVYGSDLISEARRYAEFGSVIASKEPHDLIYTHDWLSFGAGNAAKKVSGRPHIAHVHSTEFERTGERNINERIYEIEKIGMRGADRIVAVSGRTKQMIVDHYGIPHENIRVIWNGIDDATAPNSDRSVSLRLAALKDAGYKIVLFMGRITVQKGPDYFVRAAKRVIDRNPNILFIMAGSGDMEREIIHLAASLGIADKVLFPGFLRGNDHYEAYSAADLFVMPSVSEPFGLTALEAMRMGTPTIVSKQSGVAEAVKSALKVDFWDVEKMADLILSVLNSPLQRREISQKSVQEAKHLTWERTADGVRDLIDELVIAPRRTA